MIAAYRPHDEEELALVGAIISLTMQSLQAGGEAADPALPATKVARLRSDAVRLSREAHRNRRALAQYRRDRAAAQAEAAAPQAQAPDPAPPGQAADAPPARDTPAERVPDTAKPRSIWNPAMIKTMLDELARDEETAGPEGLDGSGRPPPPVQEPIPARA